MTQSYAYKADPELDLVLERVVDVAPELVWAAWTKPEYLKQWFTPKPWETVDAEVDLRPGGIFRTVFRSPEGQEHTNLGCYLEIVPNRKLVWTDALGPGFRPSRDSFVPELGFLTAIITMEPEGKGTRYIATAIHKNTSSRDKHKEMGFFEGWGTVLDQLVALAKTMPVKTILETPRLRLREMTEADLDFLASMLGDPEVMRHYPKPMDREEVLGWYQRTLGAYARAGHGFWIAELRATGEKVGQIGLLPKEINGRAEVEVAYMLHKDFWRQGIATEAALACRDYALDVLKVPRVVCMIREQNAESLAVAGRLGMRRIGETMHAGLPHLLFEYRQS